MFALGVILFIMRTGHPPFQTAEDSDRHYSMLAEEKVLKFWKSHMKTKPEGTTYFTAEFMSLVTSLLMPEPEERLTIEQVMQHPWMTELEPTYEEVCEVMLSRHPQDSKMDEFPRSETSVSGDTKSTDS